MGRSEPRPAAAAPATLWAPILSPALAAAFTRAFAAALALVGASPAVAQDRILLDEIIISAGRTDTSAERTGATVDVLTFDAARRTAQPSVAAAVDRLPGVSVSANGGPGSATTLRIRGFQSRYAPTYLNGIKLSDPSATQQDLNFGALSTLGLGRVEVLKGAGSAVYGSEAVAGVVALTSQMPSEPGTRLRFATERGSFDTTRATAGISARGERGSLAVDIGRVVTDGISSADAARGNTEADGFAATSVIAAGDVRLNDTATLGFSAFLIESTADQDGFDFLTGLPVDDAGREEARRTGLRFSADVTLQDWRHEFALSAARTDRYYPTGFTQDFDGRRRDASWQATRDLGAVRLTLGAEGSRESFRADDVTGAFDMASVLAEARLRLSDRADAAISVRRDDHSAFGAQTSVRLSGAVRPDDRTVIRTSIGTGYRAPSLYELFVPTFGNPDLRPETSRSVDIGVERRQGALTTRATAFWIEVEDLIGFTSTYDQVPGATTSRGMELSADWAVSADLSASASYTLTDSETAEGRQLFRVPRHDLTVGLDGRIARDVTAGLSLRHVAGLIDTDGGFPATAVPLDDYTVLDLSAEWELRPGVFLHGRVENATDTQYQTTRGYGTPGRAVYAGLRAAF